MSADVHEMTPRAQRAPLVRPGTVEHHAADMAFTAAADVTLDALQATLANRQQWLPIDGPGDATLGELVLTDSTGPLRLGYGAWRDLLTGVQFTNGKGELVTVGGVVVKNVAGYDLVKFLAGSHGCFGTPVTITCRTYRRPEAALVANLNIAPGALSDALAADAPPQWLLRTRSGLRGGWLGSERDLDAIEPVLGKWLAGPPQRRDLADDVAERRVGLDVGIERLRIALPPARLDDFLARANPSRYSADPAFGIVWTVVPERFDGLLALIRAAGGHATWQGRDGARLWGVGDAPRKLLASLKMRLDPDNRLPALPIED